MPVNIKKVKINNNHTNIANIFPDHKQTLKAGAYATFNNK